MKKVKGERLRVGHFYGICLDCEWSDGAKGNYDIPRARRAAKAHVRKTGHTVSIEVAHVIRYSLE